MGGGGGGGGVVRMHEIRGCGKKVAAHQRKKIYKTLQKRDDSRSRKSRGAGKSAKYVLGASPHHCSGNVASITAKRGGSPRPASTNKKKKNVRGRKEGRATSTNKEDEKKRGQRSVDDGVERKCSYPAGS